METIATITHCCFGNDVNRVLTKEKRVLWRVDVGLHDGLNSC